MILGVMLGFVYGCFCLFFGLKKTPPKGDAWIKTEQFVFLPF